MTVQSWCLPSSVRPELITCNLSSSVLVLGMQVVLLVLLHDAKPRIDRDQGQHESDMSLQCFSRQQHRSADSSTLRNKLSSGHSQCMSSAH